MIYGVVQKGKVLRAIQFSQFFTA